MLLDFIIGNEGIRPFTFALIGDMHVDQREVLVLHHHRQPVDGHRRIAGAAIHGNGARFILQRATPRLRLLAATRCQRKRENQQ